MEEVVQTTVSDTDSAADVPPANEPTQGPWTWIVHDYSCADLVGRDPYLDHILSVSPCKGCQERERSAAEKEGRGPEWKWGRCVTPDESNARLISAARELLDVARLCAKLSDKWGEQGELAQMARAAVAKACLPVEGTETAEGEDTSPICTNPNPTGE